VVVVVAGAPGLLSLSSSWYAAAVITAIMAATMDAAMDVATTTTAAANSTKKGCELTLAALYLFI